VKSRALVSFFLLGNLLACSQPTPVDVHRIVFELASGVHASFPILITQEGHLHIRNGQETLQFQLQGEGHWINPLFDGEIHGEWRHNEADTLLVGHWIDVLRSPDYRVPFCILRTQSTPPKNGVLPTHHWDFSLGNEPHTGTLLFTQPQALRHVPLEASILTSTGDYRFLSGSFAESHLKLSTFDGAHLYHFEGELKDNGVLEGEFYSGTHYRQTWRAFPLEDLFQANIPFAYVHNTIPSTIQAIGPDGQALNVDLSPSEYPLTILDITATWCPNCLDASRLIHELTADKRDSIRCVYLSFERGADTQPAQSWDRIHRYSAMIDPKATWVLGGAASKDAASQLLSFLPPITSFPTVVFLPRNGVPEVYSGFHGPATGESYKQQRQAFLDAINRLSR
jgi:thiol-disulfide isomerase/thioredoxin